MANILDILAIIFSFSVVIIFHELGHFLVAKRLGITIEEFGLGYPPRLFSKKIGETIYSLNLIPFGGFIKIYGLSHLEEKTNIGIWRSFSHQSISKRISVVISGVLMNLLLGWVLISIVFAVGMPSAILIGDVKKGGLADLAGIQKNDAFVNFKKVEEVANFLEINKGKEVSLDIKRGDKILTVKVTPRIQVPEGEGNLGIVLVETGAPKMNLFRSFWQGFLTSINMVILIFKGLIDLIIKIFTGVNVMEYFVGPVGIANMAFQATAFGIINLTRLFGIISLNLAVFNLLPLPILDGGWIFFLMLEKIRGKSFKLKTETIINGLAFVFFAFLALMVTIKDIIRWLNG